MTDFNLVMPHQPGAPRTVGDFFGWLACDVLCTVLIFGGLWAAVQVSAYRPHDDDAPQTLRYCEETSTGRKWSGKP